MLVKQSCVFISAPLARFVEASDVAGSLRGAGYKVQSRWLDVAGTALTSVLDPKSAIEAIEKNDRDMREASIVVALSYQGEGCEMHAEIARALDNGVPVCMISHGNLLPLSAYREGVAVFSHVESVIAFLRPLLSKAVAA